MLGKSGSGGGNAGKESGGLARTNSCTFEHLFLMTWFVLDAANGSQTGDTCDGVGRVGRGGGRKSRAGA